MSSENKNSKTKALPSIFGTPLTRGYLKDNPITDTVVDYLCQQLEEFATRADTPLYVDQFYIEMRIPKRTWYNWLDKYDNLREAYENARENIGFMRMVAAGKRKYDRHIVEKSQYRYGQQWVDDDEREDKRKQRIDGVKSGNITVQMIEAERTEEVPEKE